MENEPDRGRRLTVTLCVPSTEILDEGSSDSGDEADGSDDDDDDDDEEEAEAGTGMDNFN